MLQRLNIRYRMLIGYGLLIGLFIIFAGFSFWRLHELTSWIEQLYAKPLSCERHSHNILEQAIRIDRHLKVIQMSDDLSEIEENIRYVRHWQHEIHLSFDSLAVKLDSAGYYKEVKDAYDSWEKEVEYGLLEVEDEQYDDGVYIFQTDARLAFKDFEAQANDLKTYSLAQTQQHKRKMIYIKTSIKHATIMVTILFMLLGLLLSLLIVRSIAKPLKRLIAFSQQIAQGRLDADFLDIESKDEVGQLTQSLNRMKLSLITAKENTERQNRLKTGQAELYNLMRGELHSGILAKNIINYIAHFLDKQAGALYLRKGSRLVIAGRYAFKYGAETMPPIKIGEGYLGQAAQNNGIKVIEEIPSDAIMICSALGEIKPKNIIVVPLLFQERLYGIIEMLCIEAATEFDVEYLGIVRENIALAFDAIMQRKYADQQKKEE